MRRASKRKNVFTVVIILGIVTITSAIIIVTFGHNPFTSKKENIATAPVSITENTVPTTNNATNKAIEVVSVYDDAILNHESTGISASKQSSLDKAIEDLMLKTETE